MGLYFFRSDAAGKVGVCNIFVLWNEVSDSWLDGDSVFDALFGREIIFYSIGKEADPFVSVVSVPFGCIWSIEKCLERWLFTRSERFGGHVCYVVGVFGRD